MNEDDPTLVQGNIIKSVTIANGLMRVTIELSLPEGIKFNKFFNPSWQLPVVVARLKYDPSSTT